MGSHDKFVTALPGCASCRHSLAQLTWKKKIIKPWHCYIGLNNKCSSIVDQIIGKGIKMLPDECYLKKATTCKRKH